MRKTGILTALGMLTLLGCSREPVFEVERTMHDFGKVYFGEVAEHVYPFRNMGAEDLVIKQVNSSCGCTVAKLWVEQRDGIKRYGDPKDLGKVLRIHPGEEGRVQVSIDTKTAGGTVKKKGFVYLTTNEPAGQRTLEYLIEIVKAYTLEPAKVDFGRMGKNEAKLFDLELTPEKDAPLTVIKVESNHEALAADAQTDPEDPERKQIIKVAVGPGFNRTGSFNGNIRVHTSLPGKHFIDIPVLGQVVGDLVVTPQTLNFQILPKGESGEATVEIEFTVPDKKIAFGPIGIEGDGRNYLVASMEPIEAGRKFKLKLVCKPEMNAAVFRGNLRISTNYPGFPELVVPYRGFVR